MAGATGSAMGALGPSDGHGVAHKHRAPTLPASLTTGACCRGPLVATQRSASRGGSSVPKMAGLRLLHQASPLRGDPPTNPPVHFRATPPKALNLHQQKSRHLIS